MVTTKSSYRGLTDKGKDLALRKGGKIHSSYFKHSSYPICFLPPAWDHSQTQGEDTGHGELQSSESHLQQYNDTHLPFIQSLTKLRRVKAKPDPGSSQPSASYMWVTEMAPHC